ncbi:MAG: hypothetical protein ACXVP0_02035 [Bacteroidia bacterium]
MRIALCFVIILLSCSATTNDSESSVIVWKEGQLLTWDDFQGKPERRFAAASTHYDILKELTDNGNSAVMSIKAIFYSKKSWKKASWVNQSVLEHEQKHFDIVELFSRKLRKICLDRSYPNYASFKAITDSLYDVVDKDMDVYQDQYDDESNGSMDGNRQREWNVKVMAEIKALDKYKATEYTVSFRKK